MSAREETATAFGRGPEATATAFARTLLGRDASAAVSYFSLDGRCLTPDGTEVVGRGAIAELLAQLVADEQKLEIRPGRLVRAGAVALCTQYWTQSSGGAGSYYTATNAARLVLSCDVSGWEIMIAAPWD